MTVRELLQRLNALPNPDAEVVVQVPDPHDAEAPDDFTIDDVVFIDWPEHYKQAGDPLGIAPFSRPQVYIKV